MKLGVKKMISAVYLLLGPFTALYLQWVCGSLDALVRKSSTTDDWQPPIQS